VSVIPLDYETLRLIWWLLLGVLLIGFAVMGGRDLGVGTLLPFAARTDDERRVLLNLIGPTWEGNQVWLVLGGGAIFAAFPPLYAVSFSGFYLAMLVILLALILRPVGFKFRGKIEDPRWRTMWDWGLFIGGFVPALIMGVAVGNVLLGAPFHFDDSMRIFYTGNFFQLLMPFALLAGLVSVGMIATHGATLIAGRTEGAVADRARTIGLWSGVATIILFALGGVWVAFMNGYVITSVIDPNAPINPLAKTVELVQGGWLSNYQAYPWMIAAPVLGLAGLSGQQRRNLRHRGDGGCFDLPVLPAVLDHAQCRPDALGCIVEPHDAVHHAAVHAGVPAHHHCLHRLGLPGDARPGDQ
jgi:cytochrome d ubiquinol oxidase subunit II